MRPASKAGTHGLSPQHIIQLGGDVVRIVALQPKLHTSGPCSAQQPLQQNTLRKLRAALHLHQRQAGRQAGASPSRAYTAAPARTILTDDPPGSTHFTHHTYPRMTQSDVPGGVLPPCPLQQPYSSTHVCTVLQVLPYTGAQQRQAVAVPHAPQPTTQQPLATQQQPGASASRPAAAAAATNSRETHTQQPAQHSNSSAGPRGGVAAAAAAAHVRQHRPSNNTQHTEQRTPTSHHTTPPVSHSSNAKSSVPAA
jgi:hypothetical protein